MKQTIRRQIPLLDALEELFPESSRTTLRKMLQGDRVRVNGEVVIDAKRVLEAGESIDVVSKMEARSLPPELSLLHEDDDLIVVIKANGLLTVPTARETETTAQAYLDEYLQGRAHVHVVHRLDRETSGVLVFAKNFKTREKLKELFAAHDIDRVYVAIVEGKLIPANGTIESSLLEKPNLRMESVRKGHPDAKLSITHYKTIASSKQYSMLEVTLETGRKNQIRAHLSEKGHPIVGDRFYGSDVNPLGRVGLHARLLGFIHPTSGKRMKFEAPVPGSFTALLKTTGTT
jgi:23S rRNA pseudouridine1911/1915/1917 synthase